jgi:hypothetical protein
VEAGLQNHSKESLQNCKILDLQTESYATGCKSIGKLGWNEKTVLILVTPTRQELT